MLMIIKKYSCKLLYLKHTPILTYRHTQARLCPALKNKTGKHSPCLTRIIGIIAGALVFRIKKMKIQPIILLPACHIIGRHLARAAQAALSAA